VAPDYLQEHLSNWCVTEPNPPLFLNGVSGLGSPWWQSGFESRFIGEGGLAAQAVAVVESIVFLLLENLRSMDEVMSAPASLVVSGGLSRVDGFCQRLADLSGLSLRRSGEVEGTAKGLAYLLAGLPAHWQAAAGEGFEPQANAPLLARYRNWQSQMQAALAILAEQ
jgi:glycerol kinase